MRREQVAKDVEEKAFEFFFWFSRFEFALKANHYLVSQEPGARAEPNWDLFVRRFEDGFRPSFEAERLVELRPRMQVVGPQMELEWRTVGTSHCRTELCKVTASLRTVRNNLFHGGKHGDQDQDNALRNLELLATSKVVLDQLAVLAGFGPDYTREY